MDKEIVMNLNHPVLTQTEPREGVSSQYRLVNTQEIITALEGHGFVTDNVQVSGTRIEENRNKQKHMVTMRYKDMETAEGVPTIIIQNSHNRSSGLRFHTGFIRFACANGLILGEEIETTSIHHNQGWKDKANEFLHGYMESVARMEEQHQHMKDTRLSRYDMMLLSEKAVQLRYDIKDVLDPNELNQVRRVEDRGADLYHTYNRIQEALIGGMFQRQTHRIDDDGLKITSPYSKANKITSNDENIRLNTQLRELVMEM